MILDASRIRLASLGVTQTVDIPFLVFIFWSTFEASGMLHTTIKLHLITGHEDTEGEKKYSSTLSLTSALDDL
jgi:hypothetical protein